MDPYFSNDGIRSSLASAIQDNDHSCRAGFGLHCLSHPSNTGVINERRIVAFRHCTGIGIDALWKDTARNNMEFYLLAG